MILNIQGIFKHGTYEQILCHHLTAYLVGIQVCHACGSKFIHYITIRIQTHTDPLLVLDDIAILTSHSGVPGYVWVLVVQAAARVTNSVWGYASNALQGVYKITCWLQ